MDGRSLFERSNGGLTPSECLGRHPPVLRIVALRAGRMQLGTSRGLSIGILLELSVKEGVG
jgi:hypothetical protein